MKRSIARLPKRTQEELNTLRELIEHHIPECDMVILYGSYARGGYVLWDTRIEFGVRTTYQSDLDILVIVSKSNIKIVENKIRSKVIEKYEKKFEYRRHASPQIIVEYMDTVNKKLEIAQYFFTDIAKEGIMLYDNKKFQLAKPRKLKFREIKEIAQEEFDLYYPKASSFIRHGHFAYSEGDYTIGSFQLHQACERFYHSINLVFTNYRSKNHKLKELGAMVKGFSRELAIVFPLNTPFEEECYDLLCRAYIEARYNKDFKVSREQLEYMISRTEMLKEITYRICMEKMATYDKLIAEEEGEEENIS